MSALLYIFCSGLAFLKTFNHHADHFLQVPLSHEGHLSLRCDRNAEATLGTCSLLKVVMQQRRRRRQQLSVDFMPLHVRRRGGSLRYPQRSQSHDLVHGDIEVRVIIRVEQKTHHKNTWTCVWDWDKKKQKNLKKCWGKCCSNVVSFFFSCKWHCFISSVAFKIWFLRASSATRTSGSWMYSAIMCFFVVIALLFFISACGMRLL